MSCKVSLSVWFLILVWSFDKVLITYLLELKKHLKGVYSFPLLHAQVEPLWLLSL